MEGVFFVSSVVFSVEAHSENPTKTVVKAREFTITIDEPTNLGGTNAGPNPVEYVLGALAGCLNVVGHIVAKELKFELRGIKFELAGDLDPSKFSGRKTNKRAGYEEIRVIVPPDADADSETLAQWIAAMEERCPVSDNLQHPTPVKLFLK